MLCTLIPRVTGVGILRKIWFCLLESEANKMVDFLLKQQPAVIKSTSEVTIHCKIRTSTLIPVTSWMFCRAGRCQIYLEVQWLHSPDHFPDKKRNILMSEEYLLLNKNSRIWYSGGRIYVRSTWISIRGLYYFF